MSSMAAGGGDQGTLMVWPAFDPPWQRATMSIPLQRTSTILPCTPKGGGGVVVGEELGLGGQDNRMFSTAVDANLPRGVPVRICVHRGGRQGDNAVSGAAMLAAYFWKQLGAVTCARMPRYAGPRQGSSMADDVKKAHWVLGRGSDKHREVLRKGCCRCEAARACDAPLCQAPPEGHWLGVHHCRQHNSCDADGWRR